MTSKAQGDFDFWKFQSIGIFLVLLFIFFWGTSFFQISEYVFEQIDFHNQSTQIWSTDTHKIPVNGLDHFVEQKKEKEEEKQEDTFLDYSLGSIWPSFASERLFAIIPKTSFGANFRLNNHIPLYILFQNLKLDMVQLFSL